MARDQLFAWSEVQLKQAIWQERVKAVCEDQRRPAEQFALLQAAYMYGLRANSEYAPPLGAFQQQQQARPSLGVSRRTEPRRVNHRRWVDSHPRSVRISSSKEREQRQHQQLRLLPPLSHRAWMVLRRPSRDMTQRCRRFQCLSVQGVVDFNSAATSPTRAKQKL
jgi:hypothetical protein